ncbi:MAG: DHH family phosphoesterase, partial [Candidatus Saccharimonadales bacterium]|nr:DHH family phosphoesterase [Candidatus Saccharimonadales bacterium]
MQNAHKFNELINNSNKILIIQAENPDGDSLGSALALEEILGEMGKEPLLYCPVNIPRYLRFIPGWDRVSDELPGGFDLSIIVDTSSSVLLERVFTRDQTPRLSNSPLVIVDHHTHELDIPVENLPIISDTAVATGEIIYELAKQLDWPLTVTGAEMIVTAILFDSLGLTTESTTARSIHVVAEAVELGVDLSKLDNRRRELMKKSPEIVSYKADLLKRIDHHLDGRVATVVIPWEEIEKYSDEYNPSMLVLEEMRMTKGVLIAAAFKTYPDGKITCKLRSNPEAPVARDLA